MSLTIIFIISGLYLGWLLGTNDTVNIWGSEAGSEFINFKKAAFIVSTFIIAGAVFQGKGTTDSFQRLASITQPFIAFTVALCAAISVLLLIKFKLPVSVSQAIVGSILGWSIFIQAKTNWILLSEFVLSWILAPVIGIAAGMSFFILLRGLIRRSKIHLIKLDTYLRIAFLIGIALASFGLGANNIGNVTGVFANLAPDLLIDFGIFSLNGMQILSLIGAISIAVGIYSYSWKPSDEKNPGILSLAPEATVVVLATQALVLFLFSSSLFASILKSAGLIPFPLVPVSSSQIAVGAVIGIGILKGSRDIERKNLIRIGFGWVAAPIGAGVLSYSLLFIIQKLFKVPLQNKIVGAVNAEPVMRNFLRHSPEINMVLPGIIIVAALLLVVFVYLFFRQQKLRLKAEKDILVQQNQLYLSQKAMNELEMRTFSIENEVLNSKLQAKRKEFMDIALNISEQRSFLEKIEKGINEIITVTNDDESNQKLNRLLILIKQKMSFPQEKKEFYMQFDEIHKDFQMKLKTGFPELTNLEIRLAGLLRLNLSTKELSSLLNISPKSVEVARYRLKKKMNLEKDQTLNKYIHNL